MKPPKPPQIQKLDQITPTIYEAARDCVARAAWTAHGDRGKIPLHPRALLGIGVHAVLEAAKRCELAGENQEERRATARQVFDDKMLELFRSAHALLSAKFGTHDRLPYYNVHRERAALIAAEIPVSRFNPGEKGGLGNRSLVETTFRSRDERIVGRPDVLDRDSAAVIDYKTGSAPEGGRLSESEERQLRLYAFLACENGVGVHKGVVIRADRSRAEIDISPSDAQTEGMRALEVLEKYNRHADLRFEDAASPSPTTCRFCPCIPFCDAFWQAADETWSLTSGSHIEGDVTNIQGQTLISVELNVVRGSAPRGYGALTRLSDRWLTFDGSKPMVAGETIRVTDVRYIDESIEPAIFRADRVSTAVWRIMPSLE